MPTLDWIGKKSVVNHHNQVPFHLLKEVPELSVGSPDEGNLVVEGDNLVALKALLPYYAGQVKCIYIDPPYNTGNENWIYNDNVNSPEIRRWLGKVVGGEMEDLSRHDKWLCMMYPRLCLLRELLREDGAIFLSIDDNEAPHLRLILNEIFGEQNFIASIVWQKKQSAQNDAINISDMHDYILVYAKRAKTSRDDSNGWQRNLITRGEESTRRYSNPDNDQRGAWASGDCTCNKNSSERPNLYYAIINPHTQNEVWPTKQNVWRFERKTFERLISEKRIWWGKTGKNFPRFKRFISEVASGTVPDTWWTRLDGGDNQESRREIRSIFNVDEVDFSTPKPTRLIQRILQISTQPNDIVMDSFSGSGTTGHAVMKQNKEDGGSRRFILVEMDPKISREVTSERMRRVCVGHQDSSDEKVEGLGGGFRYCKLGPSVFGADGRINPEVTFPELARHVFFTETGQPIPKQAKADTPLIGTHQDKAVYLLYNGILKDKRPMGGNVLTQSVLDDLPKHDGAKVIYGTACRFSSSRLKREKITFKQIPYEIRIR